MLAPRRNSIKAEIKRLEQARVECGDSGIQKLVDAWIKEQKEKLRVNGKS